MIGTAIMLSLTLFGTSFMTATADNGLVDTHEGCSHWAEQGECDNNPGYMRANCQASCAKYDKDVLATAAEMANIHSFYDLKADDIDGNVVDFSNLWGKAVIVVNVASHCGYTESHYRSLVQLHKEVAGTEKVEIMAFPCNQFGAQEPEECPIIKAFAKRKGVEFTMMDKIDVNGATAHPVYKFLKSQAGPPAIGWNFATYFVISPDGHVQSFSGVEPLELKDLVLEMVDQEL
uniref:Glutathione peroxidase n=1 Tax=Ditylum brightwellii TaxID=49249 RepID=A0A7S2EC20_9STRA